MNFLNPEIEKPLSLRTEAFNLPLDSGRDLRQIVSATRRKDYPRFKISRQAPFTLSGIQTTGGCSYRAYCGLSQAQGGHKVQHPDGPHVTDEQRLAELYPRTQVIGAESDRPITDGNAKGNRAFMSKDMGGLLPSQPLSYLK